MSYATGGFQKLTSPPLSFVISGYHPTSGTTMDRRGLYGYYWSRSADTASDSCLLRFGSGSLSPQHNTTKSSGRSLRCVAW